MIAVLFADPKGAYSGLSNVDLWDEKRDARKYPGSYSVVAHPPCARWCRMAGLVEHRYGIKRGDDGGCFESALQSVRLWGGVLEHPAYTDAWAAYSLPVPQRGSWQRDLFTGSWVTEVSQSAYGHRARKRTWLYAVIDEPPTLDWSEPEARAWCGWGDYDKYPNVARIAKRETSATPIEFRDMLISIAKRAYGPAFIHTVEHNLK